mgnify:CR=1 FL=1
MWSLFTLFYHCSDPVIPREDAHELQVHHPPFSFLLRWIQFKISWSYPFLVSNVSPAGVLLNHSLLAIDLFWSAEDISKGSSFHSRSVQAIWRLLSHSSYLILPVQSLFQAIVHRWFFWVGPNPQVFSQDLTWLFYFPGASPKFI